jgi:hypothetical protein
MKFFGIAVFSLILEPSTAFAPFMSKPTQISQLKATNVEGWKIDGTIKPTNNFILVKKTVDQKETDSGILLSKTVSFETVLFEKNIYENETYCSLINTLTKLHHFRQKLLKPKELL